MGADAASVPFFYLGHRNIRGDILLAASKARHGGCVMGVYLRDAALRDARLYQLQQNACGKIYLDSHKSRAIDTQTPDLPPDQPILRTAKRRKGEKK